MSETPAVPRVVWRDDFSVGIASIDHEHRELVSLINHLLECLDASGERGAVADDLGEVYARISAHFALEEHVMREKQYDQLDDHKADHERLLDDIRDMMDTYDRGAYDSQKLEFAARLQDWFTAHFKTKDARLHKRLGQ